MEEGAARGVDLESWCGAGCGGVGEWMGVGGGVGWRVRCVVGELGWVEWGAVRGGEVG